MLIVPSPYLRIKNDYGIVSVHSSGPNFMDAAIQQPLGWFTPNQVHWNHLGLQMCNIMVICPSGPHGHAHRCNKDSWKLADAGIQQPFSGLILNQFHWNCLGLWTCSVMVICPSGSHGHAHRQSIKKFISASLHNSLFFKGCHDRPPSIKHNLWGAINFSLRTKYVKYKCFWHSAHRCNKGSGNLADAVIQYPLGGFTPNQVHWIWNRLGL